jgi:hypothetical protein
MFHTNSVRGYQKKENDRRLRFEADFRQNDKETDKKCTQGS